MASVCMDCGESTEERRLQPRACPRPCDHGHVCRAPISGMGASDAPGKPGHMLQGISGSGCAPELEVVGVGGDVGEVEGVGDRLDHVAALAGAVRVVLKDAAAGGPGAAAARADEHPVH